MLDWDWAAAQVVAPAPPAAGGGVGSFPGTVTGELSLIIRMLYSGTHAGNGSFRIIKGIEPVNAHRGADLRSPDSEHPHKDINTRSFSTLD